MIYGQIGRISKKKGINWSEHLSTPVHAFTTEKNGILVKAVSLCGLVKAESYGGGRPWLAKYSLRYGVYLKEADLHLFTVRPCYYCKKRHKDALVAEVMLTEGDKV